MLVETSAVGDAESVGDCVTDLDGDFRVLVGDDEIVSEADTIATEAVCDGDIDVEGVGDSVTDADRDADLGINEIDAVRLRLSSVAEGVKDGERDNVLEGLLDSDTSRVGLTDAVGELEIDHEVVKRFVAETLDPDTVALAHE